LAERRPRYGALPGCRRLPADRGGRAGDHRPQLVESPLRQPADRAHGLDRGGRPQVSRSRVPPSRSSDPGIPREEFAIHEAVTFHVVWSVIIGFVVGLIARAALPGAARFGFVATTLVGIAGSLIGGLIGRAFNKPPEGTKFHPAGFLMSIVGAIVLLLIIR